MSRPTCSPTIDTHCCVIAGQVCPALVVVDDVARCGILLREGSWEAVYETEEYQNLPVSAWFELRYPGFGCGDWPQNIPEAISQTGRCCWESK